MKTPNAKPNLNAKIAQMFRIRFSTQSEVARKLSLDRSTLNRFLRGEADIGASKFVAILRECEIDLGQLIDRRMDELLGRNPKEMSMGSALEAALSALDPISQKTILSTIVNKVEERKSPALVEESEVIKRRIATIRTVRRKNA
jgi:transcriptional regulator with XRE-family HTH domain